MAEIVRLKHVKRVRSRGHTYWYHQVTKQRLPDDPLERAQRVLEINLTLDAGWRDGPRAGSLGKLICDYKASPEFRKLKKSTRASYLHYLNLLEQGFAKKRVDRIDSAWTYKVRDAYDDKGRSADEMVNRISALMSFAVDRGWRTDNPAKRVKKIHTSTSFEAWPDVAIERFRAGANPRMVWAMELALHTGQRRGDVLAMQWRHIEGGLISVEQNKTGARLLIPVHPDLAAVLADIPRVGMNIVCREDGRAYTSSGFSAIFRRELKRLGLGGLQFHGLRHTAGSRLAEAGATDRELMSVLGHRTVSMVTKYTRGAEQERLAKAAIVKLETRRPKDGPGTNFGKHR